MKLFSGSSNLALAKTIATHANLPLGECIANSFPNNEIRLRVGDTDDSAVIVQSFSSPVHTHIIEYLLLSDALNRNGAHQIISIIPWYGYSKQDKVFSSGEPLSAKVIAKIVQLSKTIKVITMDLHNPSIAGYFDIPVVNLSAFPLFVDHIRAQPDKYSLNNCIIIAPDAGAIKGSTKVAHDLSLPVAYMNKSRNLQTGEVKFSDIDKPISGMHCFIFDDMIASGSTMIEASHFLMEKGAAKISVFATHHLYINGVQEKLDASPISSIVVTDTITSPEQSPTSNLQVISSAPIFSGVLRN